MLSDRFTKVLEVAHFFISRSKKFCFEIRLKSKIFGADATFLFRKKTFLEFSAASEIFVLWWIDGVV